MPLIGAIHRIVHTIDHCRHRELKIGGALRRGLASFAETHRILKQWTLQIRNRAIERMSFSDVDQVKFHVAGKPLINLRQPTG